MMNVWLIPGALRARHTRHRPRSAPSDATEIGLPDKPESRQNPRNSARPGAQRCGAIATRNVCRWRPRASASASASACLAGASVGDLSALCRPGRSRQGGAWMTHDDARMRRGVASLCAGISGQSRHRRNPKAAEILKSRDHDRPDETGDAAGRWLRQTRRSRRRPHAGTDSHGHMDLSSTRLRADA